MSPAALVMPGPRPACQGLSVSRVITVCDPAFGLSALRIIVIMCTAISAGRHRELFPGWLFFSAVTNRRKLAPREFILSPGGLVFFGVPGVDTWGYGGVYTGAASSILPRRACPCEYVARRPPHRRWVQETQPHTYGCAERILTAEFQLFFK